MSSQSNGGSVSILDTRQPRGDESSSIASTNSTDTVYATPSLQQQHQGQQQRERFETMHSNAEAANAGHHDDAAITGRQADRPLPPELAMPPPPPSPPSNLSDYARVMLQHTKQQMDATPGSPPPSHIHVAGPAGRQQQDQRDHDHHQNRQHRRGHRLSLNGDTTATMPNGVMRPAESAGQ